MVVATRRFPARPNKRPGHRSHSAIATARGQAREGRSIVASQRADQRGGVIFAGEKSGGEYKNAYASSDNVVRNNVISNSREFHNIESWWGGPVGTGNVATRNCVWDGADGNISDTVGFRASKNVVARPAFRNPAAGDFRLKQRSVCRRIRWGR